MKFVLIMKVEKKAEIIKNWIKDYCKKRLSSYKVPNKVFFWESLPKTASKKLIRRKVREKINI